MDCRADRHGYIEQYLRGELQPNLQDEFEVHMLGCDRCQQALELLETTRHDLMQRAHIIRANTVPKGIGFRWQWAALVVAGLALFAAGLARWNRPSRSPISVVAPPHTPSPMSGFRSNELSSVTSSDSPTQKREASPQVAKTPSNSNPGVSSKSPASIARPMQPAPTLHDTHSAKRGADVLASLPEPVPPFSGVSPTRDPTNADNLSIQLFKLGTIKPPPSTLAKVKYHVGAFRPPEKIKGYQQIEDLARAERWVFHDAMVAYNKGHYEEASRLLDDSVHIEPDAPDVNFYLGICRLLQGHSADSLPPLQKAFDKPDSPITQAAHFYLAKAHLQIGHLIEAETEFKAASEIAGPLQAEAASSLEQLRLLRAKSGASNP